MYTITYNLKEERPHSDAFYNDLEAYAGEVFNEMDEHFYETVQSYFRYRRINGGTEVYALEEAYLELLILGVLWQVYSGDALASDEAINDMMTKLFELREGNKHLKPVVDFFRGICMTTMMSPDLYDHISLAQPLVENLQKLLDWLEATGEFKHEITFLEPWYAYIRLLEPAKQVSLLQEILSLGIWFEQHSIEGLGAYTKEVDRFLNEVRPKHYFKEDVLFCGRRRVEYHLNMVGALLLNKAYRADFKKKSDALVVLPTCLRISEAACRATSESGWLKCTQCNPHCAVNDVEQAVKPWGTKVYMLPHTSSFSAFPETLSLKDCGIIGVSCVLNLIEGGWMLRERGIPAQCVLLDYCGCKAHWHHEGMPTQLNLNQLKKILE